jgi:hypothetical protein
MKALDHRDQESKFGNLRLMTRLLALATVLTAAPGALRALAPVSLTLLEIVLGLAQACVAFLRANGI